MWLWVLLVGQDCRLQVVLPQGAGTMPGFPSSVDKSDPFRLSVNPAFLPFSEISSGGVIVEKPWSIKNLKLIHAQYQIPWKSFGTSIGLVHFGNREYRRNRIEVMAGKKLGKVNLGIGLVYEQTIYAGYTSSNKVGFSVGMLLYLNEEIKYFNKISGGSTAETGISFIDQFENGLEYQVSSQVCIGVAAIKQQDNEIVYQINCLYRPVQLIDIDIGMISGISTVYLNVKYSLKNISVRSGFRFGQFIGVVPAMGVIYERERE